MNYVVLDVAAERERQKHLGWKDEENSVFDWVAFINAYTGRAVESCWKDNSDPAVFRESMIKAAALCVAAVESLDKGHLTTDQS